MPRLSFILPAVSDAARTAAVDRQTRRQVTGKMKSTALEQVRDSPPVPLANECNSGAAFLVHVALTYFPGGRLLTGFAMRSDPKGFSEVGTH